MEHGVAERDGGADQRQQHTDEQQPGAVAVHDRVDAEAHRVRQPCDAAEMHQTPAQALDLSAELAPSEPHQEARAGASVRYPGIRIRKIADLHDAP